MTGREFGQLRAFPVSGASDKKGNGMTLRSWLAGMSLCGIQANPCNSETLFKEDAKLALETADALCELLAKEQE